MQMGRHRSAQQRSVKERSLPDRAPTGELKFLLQSRQHHSQRHPQQHLKLQQHSWQLLWAVSSFLPDSWQQIQALWVPGRVAWWLSPVLARLIQAHNCSMSIWYRVGRRRMRALLVGAAGSAADHQELLTTLPLVPHLPSSLLILLWSEQLIAADLPKERGQVGSDMIEVEQPLNVKMPW